MATTPPTKQSLLQEINLLTERFTGFMESSSHSDVIEKLDSCKQQLNSLTTEIDSITDESLDESRAQLSAADIQIKQMKQYLRPEFLCGIPDEEWNGCAPPSLVMTDIPNEVRQGQGGWDKSDFLFEIRGKSYLYDNVKIASQTPLFNLRGVQLVQLPSLRPHIINEPWCVFPKEDDGNEWLIMNYMVPAKNPYQMVCYFTASDEAKRVIRGDSASDMKANGSDEQPSPASPREREGWEALLARFWQGEQEFCDERFKLIPSVTEGPWVVKMAVGNKPALLGKKLRLHYTRGPRFMEIDLDIGSSSVASRVLTVVRDSSRLLTVDMGVTLEGQDDEELPERILCRLQWRGVDLSKARPPFT